MPIVCVGVSHRTAPVAVRERLAFSEEAHRAALRGDGVRAAGAPFGLTQFAILSTCNRTELYAASDDVSQRFAGAPAAFSTLLPRLRGLSAAEFEGRTYAHSEGAAVGHLCRVATGLDSLVLGESEILGQVTTAHAVAVELGTTGPALDAAFRAAVRAGRRARAETGIGRHATSVGSEAVRVAREAGHDLARARVLIVGTGKMGRLAGLALAAHGVTDLRVVSRTAAHAERLAGALGARPLAWHALEHAIRDADVVVASTGAPHAVLTAELVHAARGDREGQPLLLLDIAIPRDVEPAVRGIRGVTVFDLDDLQASLRGGLARRQEEIPRVEAIVTEEVAQFEQWRREAEARPLIGALRARSEAIRQAEVARALRRLAHAPEEVRAQLDYLSRALTNKLLHAPTRRLRELPDDEQAQETYARVARDLFGLDERA